jgi:glycosyltransferase involved in cell wall biosynthesis
MQCPPLVSVIIPLYNGAKYINEALRSVLQQSYEPLEVIVVDDGSTDGSHLIVENVADSRVRLYRQGNKGRCFTRNVGLNAARGHFIKYLDQDDVLHCENIALQVADLKNESTDVISFGTLKLFDESLSDCVDLEMFERLPYKMDPIQFYCELGPGAVQTSVWLTPRELHLKGGHWNTDLPQNPMDDGELFMRIVMRSSGVKYCRDSVVYHRRGHRERGSNHSSPERIRSLFESITLYTAELLKAENSPRTRAVCAEVYKRYVYLHHSFDPQLTCFAFEKLRELGNPKAPSDVGGRLFRKIEAMFGCRAALRGRALAKRFLRDA